MLLNSVYFHHNFDRWADILLVFACVTQLLDVEYCYCKYKFNVHVNRSDRSFNSFKTAHYFDNIHAFIWSESTYHDHFQANISSRFSKNSEVTTSEFLENLEVCYSRMTVSQSPNG